MVARCSLFLAAVAFVAGAPARSAPPIPTGPWNVNYDDEQCVASRTYGEPEKPIYLVLKPSPAGGVMRLLVSRRGGGSVAQASATIRLGDGAPIKTQMLAYGEPQKRQRVIAANLSMNEFKRQSGASAIQISSPELSQRFDTPGLAKVVAALDECLIDLQQFWHVNPEQTARVPQSAGSGAPLVGLFSASDYPMIAVVNSQGGSVKVGVLVDESGRVADCSVEETSDVASLDTMTC